jgi:hypothetical protein
MRFTTSAHGMNAATPRNRGSCAANNSAVVAAELWPAANSLPGSTAGTLASAYSSAVRALSMPAHDSV